MDVFKNTLSAGLLTTFAAITIPVSSAQAQVTIVRVNGGGSQPGNSVGSGTLTSIFNAACDWWEDALVTSPYTLTLTYRWGTQSGGTLAAHTLNSQSGGRETAGTIVFDNDGSSVWYRDGSPCNPSEWSTFTEGTGSYGGGTMVNQARYSGPSGQASGRHDLFGVALHEIGHALGLSSANTAFQAERGDNDVDVTSPRPYPGSSLPLNSSSAHLAINTALMWPSVSAGIRNIPSEADMLANAQISQMTGITYVSFDGCSRYIAGESGTTGVNNLIPFGTAAPSTLTTLFAQNNQGSVGGAVYFDVIPTAASSHVYMHGISVNTTATSGPITADIYRRAGTYVGATGSSAGWTLWTTAMGTAAGPNNPSELEFNSGIYLASGTTNGIAVVARDFAHHYTSSANSFNNADMTVNLGAASNAPFDGSPFSPRTANVTLHYQRDSGTWSNQKYQTILRCHELGGAGSITGLAFNPDTTGVHYNRLLRIRMTHKPAGYNLSTNFGTNISGYTQVLNEFDHSWNVGANQWNEIGLQSAFAYNGTSDVVVEIMCRGNHTSTGTTGTFHRDGATPRAFACGFPWSAEPTTTTGGTAVEGIDMAGTKIRVEFECANVGYFGTSCGDAFADAVGSPLAGSSYDFHVHSAPPSSGAFVILGFSVPGTPLSTSGFNGCYAWIDNVASTFKVTNTFGFAAHTVSVPSGSGFNGLKIYGQWAALDPAAAGGLTFTNYVRSIIGQDLP